MYLSNLYKKLVLLQIYYDLIFYDFEKIFYNIQINLRIYKKYGVVPKIKQDVKTFQDIIFIVVGMFVSICDYYY